MSTHERLKTVLERLKADCQLLHEVLHKGHQVQIATENGPLKTIAGIIKETEQRCAVPAAKLHQAMANVEQLQRDVVRLCHDAMVVRDRALKEPLLRVKSGLAQTPVDEDPYGVELSLHPAMEAACYVTLMRNYY